MKAIVTYKVNSKLYSAGPYDLKDVDFHRDDIAGFAGITDVEVIEVDEVLDSLTGTKSIML